MGGEEEGEGEEERVGDEKIDSALLDEEGVRVVLDVSFLRTLLDTGELGVDLVPPG